MYLVVVCLLTFSLWLSAYAGIPSLHQACLTNARLSFRGGFRLVWHVPDKSGDALLPFKHLSGKCQTKVQTQLQ